MAPARYRRVPALEAASNAGALMNAVFFGIVLLAVLFAAWNFTWLAMAGDMEAAAAVPAALGEAALSGSKTAVTLAIGLVGYMALFLGLM